MSNLKEIRGRIASVRSTLKITSAMRLISSAKLHSAQNAIGAYLPYEKALSRIFGAVLSAEDSAAIRAKFSASAASGRSAVVLVSSNQTLCGSFNANILKRFQAQNYDPAVTTVYAVGKTGLKSVRRFGFSDVVDCCDIARKPVYSASASLAKRLVRDFLEGRISRVELVYSHMVSNSTQLPTKEVFLPFDISGEDLTSSGVSEDVIFEPSPSRILETLIPQYLRTKLHSVMLDAAASEHAARTLAMQIASDNAEDLLSELTLTHNKLRQQAITNELLDLVGGQIDN